MITTDLNLVIETLKKDDVVAIPTETVYGLAGNAFKDSSVEKIFQLKERPAFNPLIVHIAKPELLEGLVAKLKPTPERLAKTSFNELNKG